MKKQCMRIGQNPPKHDNEMKGKHETNLGFIRHLYAIIFFAKDKVDFLYTFLRQVTPYHVRADLNG